MKYEILNEQGEVVNTIIAKQEFVDSQYPLHRAVEEAAQPNPLGTRISGNAFLARFGNDLETLYALAMTTPKIQIYRDKVLMAKNGIDLASDITITDVSELQASGLISQERRDAILDTATITESELP